MLKVLTDVKKKFIHHIYFPTSYLQFVLDYIDKAWHKNISYYDTLYKSAFCRVLIRQTDNNGPAYK